MSKANVNNHAAITLKNLQSRLSAARTDYEALKEQQNEIARKMYASANLQKELEEKIRALTDRSGVVVTEHAMIRYLERVQGISLATLSSEICPEDIEAQIEVLGGTGVFPVPEKGYSLRVRDGKVITILTPSGGNP